MGYAINGKPVDAKVFGFDGCHKFYVCTSEEGRDRLIEYGYELFPMDRLPEFWAGSCPLRFIETADLAEMLVPQCEPARFEGFPVEPWLERELLEIEVEQRVSNGQLTEADAEALLGSWETSSSWPTVGVW